MKIPDIYLFSRYFILFPDPNAHLYCVIGKGIKFPKIDNPTYDDIDKYHKLYFDKLS